MFTTIYNSPDIILFSSKNLETSSFSSFIQHHKNKKKVMVTSSGIRVITTAGKLFEIIKIFFGFINRINEKVVIGAELKWLAAITLQGKVSHEQQNQLEEIEKKEGLQDSIKKMVTLSLKFLNGSSCLEHEKVKKEMQELLSEFHKTHKPQIQPGKWKRSESILEILKNEGTSFFGEATKKYLEKKLQKLTWKKEEKQQILNLCENALSVGDFEFFKWLGENSKKIEQKLHKDEVASFVQYLFKKAKEMASLAEEDKVNQWTLWKNLIESFPIDFIKDTEEITNSYFDWMKKIILLSFEKSETLPDTCTRFFNHFSIAHRDDFEKFVQNMVKEIPKVELSIKEKLLSFLKEQQTKVSTTYSKELTKSILDSQNTPAQKTTLEPPVEFLTEYNTIIKKTKKRPYQRIYCIFFNQPNLLVQTVKQNPQNSLYQKGKRIQSLEELHKKYPTVSHEYLIDLLDLSLRMHLTQPEESKKLFMHLKIHNQAYLNQIFKEKCTYENGMDLLEKEFFQKIKDN